MFARMLALSVCLAGATMGWAAEGDDLKALQSTADDLRLRDEALTELSNFLSALRTQVRGHCYMMKKFITSQGKLDDYLSKEVKVVQSEAAYMAAVGKKKELERAGIVLPDSPMTFEDAVELAIQYTESEGGPAMDVADADEVEMLKRSCKAKGRLARKVFDHLTEMFYEEMAMLAYLKSIGGEQAFRKYASTEIARQGRERQSRSATTVAMRARMKRMGAKHGKTLSESDKYKRVLKEFKLQQQIMVQQRKVKIAKDQQGGFAMEGRMVDPGRRFCDYAK